jgi:hypothetical protein
VHFWKIIVGFCAYLEVPRGILCIFVSSSYNVVHFWKFLVIFCAFLEFPHGKGYTCPFDHFTFFSTKYVFLQHAYWLIADIAGCNQFNTSSCNHEYPGNTAKVDAEEVDSNICLAKISLIRTKPDNFYDMIWFFTYFILAISTISKLWLRWTIDDSTILRTLWTFFKTFVDRNIWKNT